MVEYKRVSDDFLAYLSNIPPNLSLASWSLRMPFIASDLRAIAHELIGRRADDVVRVPLDDVDDFDAVTQVMSEPLLAHLRAASALEDQ